MKLVNKKDFVEAVLNHKDNVVISMGDAAGEQHFPLDMNSVFYDTVKTILEHDNFLSFSNTLNTKNEGNGRWVASSIHEFSHTLLDTNAITSIREYDGDYLSDTFVTAVQRCFELEICDEIHNASSLYCIGLL